MRTASLSLLALILVFASLGEAQDRRGDHGRAPSPRPPIAVRGHLVFIGGYYYDPFFGPYPWWPRAAYPYRYFPIFDYRAQVRVQARPKTAAVYVDGFYAGIVDDFDGTFQSLPLPPGSHEIVLFLDGFRTFRQPLYLRPATTLKLHHTLEQLPPGSVSEPPTLAPPLPPPPPGSFSWPRTPPPEPRPPVAASPRASAPPSDLSAAGTIELHVQPVTAEVTIDGERWMSSDPGYFVIELAPGSHTVSVTSKGRRPFSTEVTVTDGVRTPLNVTLAPDTP